MPVTLCLANTQLPPLPPPPSPSPMNCLQVPVPSFRMRNICPFEIRRFRLAQAGRLLQREVDCPLGE